MTSTPPAAGDLDIVIFGGAGDLSFRKLLPALYMAHLHDKLDADTRIIAVGRNNWSRDAYLAFIDKNSPAFIDHDAFNATDWQNFLGRLTYVSLDITQAADFAKLKDLCPTPALRVFYLATAPSLFTQICANLSSAGLIDAQSRVVLEKPLGTDLVLALPVQTLGPVGMGGGASNCRHVDHDRVVAFVEQAGRMHFHREAAAVGTPEPGFFDFRR